MSDRHGEGASLRPYVRATRYREAVEQVFVRLANGEPLGNSGGACVRVLGVDPGLTRCGLGVVEGTPGRALRALAVDVIRTPASASLGERLLRITTTLEDWIETYEPDAVAVERVFAQHNVRTVMGTAQVSAVAIVAAARRGIPVALHTPSEVKAAVSGSGRADKAQVTSMVVRLLMLTERPTPADAADALALAICHIWRGVAVARLDEALARSRVPAAGSPRSARSGEEAVS